MKCDGTCPIPPPPCCALPCCLGSVCLSLFSPHTPTPSLSLSLSHWKPAEKDVRLSHGLRCNAHACICTHMRNTRTHTQHAPHRSAIPMHTLLHSPRPRHVCPPSPHPRHPTPITPPPSPQTSLCVPTLPHTHHPKLECVAPITPPPSPQSKA